MPVLCNIQNKKLTLSLEQGLSLSQKKEINFGAASAWEKT